MAEYQVHLKNGNNILVFECKCEPKISEISSEFKSGELSVYEKVPFEQGLFGFELKLVAKIIV